MDCLGASVGLWTTIKQLGKNCNIILEQDINAIEYYLEQLKKDSSYDNMFITGEEAEKYMTQFKEPEQISREEVEADMGFTIYCGL